MSLAQRVQAETKRLAPVARKLLLAVSGGADSVAMLRFLAESDFAIEVAHFDHALRVESADDALFVEDLCAGMNIPFHSDRVEVGRIATVKKWNVEEAARKLRYSFLTRTAKGVSADAIVTAHTQNDQAETILMQLFRGAAYLTGMKARHKHVIRPLLDISREDLLEYLESKNQSFTTDETNFDTSYTRAWLRYEIIPVLEVRYPGVRQTLVNLGTLQQGQLEFIQQAGRRFIQNKSIQSSQLKDAYVALQRQAIVDLLEDAGIGSSFKRVEELRSTLVSDKPVRIQLSESKLARTAYGELKVVEQRIEKLEPQEVRDGSDLPDDINEEILKVYPNLVLRSREAGDVITLSGGTKKLKDVLINRKIPKEERNALRVLAFEKQVFWLEGVATDPRFAIQSENLDVKFMKLALEEAQLAFEEGELPIGAVIVKDGTVVATTHNQTEAFHDPTAHAEILAIRRAASLLGDWRLADYTLYVTLEPCPMCFGAIQQAHLVNLVYAADNHREGAFGSVANINTFEWKRQINVKKGIMANEASKLLALFFKEKRKI